MNSYFTGHRANRIPLRREPLLSAFGRKKPWYRKAYDDYVPDLPENTNLTIGIGLGAAALIGVAAGFALMRRDKLHQFPTPAIKRPQD